MSDEMARRVYDLVLEVEDGRDRTAHDLLRLSDAIEQDHARHPASHPAGHIGDRYPCREQVCIVLHKIRRGD